MVKVTINRASVAMGDDVYNHEITIDTPATINLKFLFDDLVEADYFPKVEGNNVVWVLNYDKREWITWKTQGNVYYSPFIDTSVFRVELKSENQRNTIFFSYYSPVIRRAFTLFKDNNGIKNAMILKGVMSEYLSYNVPEALERKWLKELKMPK